MKIVITRPRQQSETFAEKLRFAGMEPIFFPVIDIRTITDNARLQKALANLAGFDWVVFTSANGVKVVGDMLTKMGLNGIPPEVRVAAIGPKTAEALRSMQIIPAFVPGDFIAEAIAPGMGDLKDKKVLLPRALIARKALPQAITAAGGVVHEVAVYQTVPAQADEEGLHALRMGGDVVSLTSSSIVINFIKLVSSSGLDPRNLPGNPVYACIGPITGQAAREQCLPNLVVAKTYSTDGLLLAIQALDKR